MILTRVQKTAGLIVALGLLPAGQAIAQSHCNAYFAFDGNLQDSGGKHILKDVLAGFVPASMFERPKMGFGVPIDSWLRGPLRDWAESLLDESRLRQEGYFQPEPIRQKWEAHLSGRVNWHYHLWDVLMFQSWLESGSAIDGRSASKQ